MGRSLSTFNFYLCDIVTGERQRVGHKIVQSRVYVIFLENRFFKRFIIELQMQMKEHSLHGRSLEIRTHIILDG